MTAPHTAPYGSWRSPVTADLIVGRGISLGQTAIEGEDIYWTEGRPAEQGRVALLHHRLPPRNDEGSLIGSAEPKTTEVIPAPYNVRTRVHEYGGGAFAVKNGVVVFSNFADQRLYRSDPGKGPRPITPERDWRFADGVIDAVGRTMFCVREDHESGSEPKNTIVSVDLDGERDPVVLAEGYDFYAAPRLSPGRLHLSWLCWNHPNMPWDGSELWIARLEPDGTLSDRRRVAGGPHESIVQPEWSPDGFLYFVSDRSGWWNLYRLHDKPAAGTEAVAPVEASPGFGIDDAAGVPEEWAGEKTVETPGTAQIDALFPTDAEFARPPWLFGSSSYAFETPDRILCAYARNGLWRLARLHVRPPGGGTGRLEDINLSFTEYTQLRATGGHAVFLGASPDHPVAVVVLDLVRGTHHVVRTASPAQLDSAALSRPEPIDFPSDGRTGHGFFYAPVNPEFAGPPGEKPPLLVMSHGGPTSAAGTSLSLAIQFWTSRGIAVLDVNYGGSSGWGRAYRDALNGNWGIVDVEDCIAGALFLASQGKVDGNRLAITGGSAGGYTTLCALTFRNVFKAGASHFGVSDPAALARDTHKFESRYLDRLIGPYPERADLYRERSPIDHAEQLSTPVIFFQGLDDKVVPADQAKRMVEVLRRKKVPVAYIPFAGEGHGFRMAENIKRALEAELYFYGKVFGFTPADPIEPVPIENLG